MFKWFVSKIFAYLFYLLKVKQEEKWKQKKEGEEWKEGTRRITVGWKMCTHTWRLNERQTYWWAVSKIKTQTKCSIFNWIVIARIWMGYRIPCNIGHTPKPIN